MDYQAIFGGVSIGRDTSGVFKLTADRRIAVLTSPGKWLASDGKSTTDVSPLILSGTERYIYRLPVDTVAPGDIVVTQDNPLQVLFLTEQLAEGHLRGIDALTGSLVEYVTPTNLFDIRFFVKVVDLTDTLSRGLGGNSDDRALLLFLSGSQAGTTSPGTDDGQLTALALTQVLQDRTQKRAHALPLNPLLLLPLLSGSKGAPLEALLLAQAFSRQRSVPRRSPAGAASRAKRKRSSHTRQPAAAPRPRNARR